MTTADNENISNPISLPWMWICWIIVIIAALSLCAANIVFGNLNQDEGWYLYAARLVAAGQIPYRDFAFTQGPAMPCFYSLFQPFIERGGLMAGRGITALLGITGAVFAAILAGRLARPARQLPAVFICFMLISINVYQSYFCTVVKTYSLTILFLGIAFFLLHYALAKTSRIVMMLSAALFVLAAFTRPSAAIILPIVFILLLWERKKTALSAWLYFLLGGIIASAFVLEPFLVNCPFNFYYFAGRYHSLRNGGDWLGTLVFKGGFVSRVLQAYFVCFAVWITALAIKSGLRQLTTVAGRGEAGPGWPLRPCSGQAHLVTTLLVKRTLWLSVIAVSLIHFSAPFPYDDYQVFIYPLFAVVVSVMILDALPDYAGKILLPAVFCLCLASSISSPINQDWFIEGRELIWWHSKDKPPIIKLREAAREISKNCKPGDLLLTQDPYLAVESGTTLPHGLEMGQFSYFPDLTKEQALGLKVLNRELMTDLLQNCNASMAALSGYAFAMKSPAVRPTAAGDKEKFMSIISNRYELISTVPNFGQASTKLHIYRKKTLN